MFTIVLLTGSVCNNQGPTPSRGNRPIKREPLFENVPRSGRDCCFFCLSHLRGDVYKIVNERQKPTNPFIRPEDERELSAPGGLHIRLPNRATHQHTRQQLIKSSGGGGNTFLQGPEGGNLQAAPSVRATAHLAPRRRPGYEREEEPGGRLSQRLLTFILSHLPPAEVLDGGDAKRGSSVGRKQSGVVSASACLMV